WAPATCVLSGRFGLDRSKGRDYTTRELLPIGQQDLYDAANRLAILDGDHGHGDFVAGLEGLLGPAAVAHGGRIFSFRAPMHYLAAVIGCVELQHAMGIGPQPLHHGSLHGHCVVGVAWSVTVMRTRR